MDIYLLEIIRLKQLMKLALFWRKGIYHGINYLHTECGTFISYVFFYDTYVSRRHMLSVKQQILREGSWH